MKERQQKPGYSITKVSQILLVLPSTNAAPSYLKLAQKVNVISKCLLYL